jgi:mycothiol synthase
MDQTLVQRSLRADDAPAVTEILAAMERAEPVDEAYSQQDVVEEMTSPGVDLERGTLAVLDGDRLVAFGELHVSPPAPAWKAYLWGGVLPEYTHRGIGRQVVVGMATAMRDAQAPGSPGELKMWIESGRPGTAAVAKTAGFDTWRYFLRMRRDLREPLFMMATPAGVLIRPYRDSDDDAVRLVSNESFADHWGSTPLDAARWRAEFAESSSFRPACSFVATVDWVRDAPVVSFVLTSEFEAETAQRGYRTGYVARVGTSRAARGRGVAGALLAHALTALADAGDRYAELGVDAESPTGAGRLYERAGFVTITTSRVVGRHI